MFGYLVFGNEETSVSAFDVVNALEEMTQFIGKTLLPNFAVFVRFHEVTVFQCVACDFVDDGANEVCGLHVWRRVCRSDDAIHVFKEILSCCYISACFEVCGGLHVVLQHERLSDYCIDDVGVGSLMLCMHADSSLRSGWR